MKVEAFLVNDIKRHGCPSHGIGLTPDDRETHFRNGKAVAMGDQYGIGGVR